MTLPPTTPPPPSEQDASLIQQYLLHTILLEMLEADVQLIPELDLRMAEIYLMRLNHLQSGIHHSLQTIREHMRHQGIRIEQITRHPIGVEIHYLCRGYHQYMSLLDSQIQSHMDTYFSACEHQPLQ